MSCCSSCPPRCLRLRCRPRGRRRPGAALSARVLSTSAACLHEPDRSEEAEQREREARRGDHRGRPPAKRARRSRGHFHPAAGARRTRLLHFFHPRPPRLRTAGLTGLERPLCCRSSRALSSFASGGGASGPSTRAHGKPTPSRSPSAPTGPRRWTLADVDGVIAPEREPVPRSLPRVRELRIPDLHRLVAGHVQSRVGTAAFSQGRPSEDPRADGKPGSTSQDRRLRNRSDSCRTRTTAPRSCRQCLGPRTPPRRTNRGLPAEAAR